MPPTARADEQLDERDAGGAAAWCAQHGMRVRSTTVATPPGSRKVTLSRTSRTPLPTSASAQSSRMTPARTRGARCDGARPRAEQLQAIGRGMQRRHAAAKLVGLPDEHCTATDEREQANLDEDDRNDDFHERKTGARAMHGVHRTSP